MRSILMLLLIATLTARADEDGRIAARINDEIITWSDVEQEIKLANSDDKTLRKSVIRQLAERRIFLQEAKLLAITVTEDEIDKAIDMEVKTFGSREKLLDYLRFIGVTPTAYRESKRENTLINKMIQTKYHQLQNLIMTNYIAPQEIREYYDGHKPQFRGKDEATIRRITLLFDNEQAKATKRREAESILRRIREGASFSFLALYHDETDLHGAPQSGVKRDGSGLTPPIVAAAFDRLKPGEVSDIIEEKNSLTILKLEGRDRQSELSFEEAQIIIRKILQQQQWTKNRAILRDELLKKTYYEPADIFQ